MTNKIDLKHKFIRDGEYFKDEYLGINYFSIGGRGLPKTGLVLYNHLISEEKGKYANILEIGTGELAFLANTLCKVHTTATVHATEIDRESYNQAINNLHSKNLQIYLADTYPNLDVRYDLVVSNPPQMPSKKNTIDHHNSGGKDGLNIIIKIFEGMKKNSTLLLSIFDFLGVERKYGRDRSFLDLLEKFKGIIIYKRKFRRYIRMNGETYKNMEHILTIAPMFSFKKDKNGNIYHNLYLIKIEF